MKTIDDLAHLLDTPDAFRDWLESLKPDEPCGQTDDGTSCPIAEFAHHEGFGPNIFIGPDTIEVREHAGWCFSTLDDRETPDWAKKFVHLVDQYSPDDYSWDEDDEDYWDGSVPAAEALAALSEALHA